MMVRANKGTPQENSQRVMVAGIVAAAALYLLVKSLEGYAPQLEGRWFPVVSRAELLSHTALPPPSYRTRWNATAQKYRDCEYIETRWYLGPRGGRRVQVTAEHQDPPQVRDVGRLEWSGLIIWLDPVATRQNSHADVVHRCHGFWNTISPFYG